MSYHAFGVGDVVAPPVLSTSRLLLGPLTSGGGSATVMVPTRPPVTMQVPPTKQPGDPGGLKYTPKEPAPGDTPVYEPPAEEMPPIETFIDVAPPPEDNTKLYVGLGLVAAAALGGWFFFARKKKGQK